MTRYDTTEIKRAARLDDVVAKRGYKISREGKKLWISCPFGTHQDTTPSLCLEPEKLVWHCHGCGQGGSVIDFVMKVDSLTTREAIENLAREYGLVEEKEQPRRKTGEWKYTRVDGSHAYTIERWEPGKRGRDKEYLQRLPDGSYGKCDEQILYRLDEAIFADLVFVAEGEKCADAVAKLGLVGTTWAGGTSIVEALWIPAFASPLKGKRVVLLPDDDDNGRKAMKLIANILAPIAKEVRVLDLKAKKPGKDKGGDVANWVDAGGTKDKLLALADSAPLFMAESAPGQRDDLKYTDSGNAELFVKQHGERLRWSSAAGAWLLWDDRRWVADRGGNALRLTKETLRSMYEGLEDLPAGQQVQLVRHIVASGKSARRQAVLTLAAVEPGMSVVPEQLDADPWILCVENGTINLKTGELRAHRRSDFCTKLAPVRYDEAAKAPAFEAFIAQILPDADVRCFVQRMLGYALTGVVADHVLPVFYGTGGNGKGTLMTTVQSVLGEYARQVPATLLMARKDEGHPTEKASLFGCRLAVASETKKNAPLSEETVKHLTGGDVISARFMRQDFFDFPPTHKLVLQTNYKPRVTGTDNGIWRRVRLVPFTVSVPEEKQDTALASKLKSEAPGILRWLVDGCLQWQQHGLGREGAVAAATEEYRKEQDHFGGFIEDCVVADADQVIGATDFHNAYKKWAERQGQRHVMSQRSFGLDLKDRGFGSSVLHGRVVYRGLRLREGDQGDHRRSPTHSSGNVTPHEAESGDPPQGHLVFETSPAAADETTSELWGPHED